MNEGESDLTDEAILALNVQNIYKTSTAAIGLLSQDSPLILIDAVI